MKRFIEGEDRGKGTLLPELLDEAALLEKGLTVTTGRYRPKADIGGYRRAITLQPSQT